MTALKHYLDGALGKKMICNEGTNINNMNNDKNNEEVVV